MSHHQNAMETPLDPTLAEARSGQGTLLGNTALDGAVLSTEELAVAADHLRPIGDNQAALLGCGDDRRMTRASADRVVAQLYRRFGERLIDPRDEGLIRAYGGAYGLATMVAVAGTMHHGDDFIERAGGFNSIVEPIVEKFAKQLSELGDGTMIGHTDEKSEGRDDVFQTKAEKEIGCLYCKLLGTCVALTGDKHFVTAPEAEELQVARQGIQAAARDVNVRIYGNDDGVDAMFHAYGVLARHLGDHGHGDPHNFKIGRSNFAKAQQPVERRPGEPGVLVGVLEGDHNAAADTALLLSFMRDHVSVAGKYYGYDVVKATEEIMKVLHFYRIPAEVYIQVMTGGVHAVRAGLSGHDKAHGPAGGPLDPNGLRIGWFGHPNDDAPYLNRKYND